MREVKRKAKVGEYVKIVDKYLTGERYKNGDILKVVDDCAIGCWVETPTDNHVAILDKEYVVLEDYNPTEFHVGDRVQIKSWEEMENVNSFTIIMRHLCGRTATIEAMYDERITLTDWSDTSGDLDWFFYTNMVKKVDDCISFIKINGESLQDTNIVYKQDTLIEEEDNMNKVLELWKNRKLEKLRKEYKKGIDEYRNGIDIVKKYNQLVEQFERDMQDLYIMDEEHKYIEKDCEYCYMYTTNEINISDEYRELKGEEYTNKEKEIHDTGEEVEAQLSLSNDLEYQKEVLTNYGILDKKTGKIKVD